MEKEPDIMPNFDLFPKIERVANFIKRLVSFLPTAAPDYMSEHYRGAAAQLDSQLYDGELQIPHEQGKI